MSEAIRVTCRGADTLPVDTLLEFQGNLKSLSDGNLRRDTTTDKQGGSNAVC